MIELAPAAVCVAALFACLVADARGWSFARGIAKLVASFAFVAYALTSGAFRAGVPGRAVVLALILSVVGDALLLSKEKRFFLAGIGFFLLAHLGYVAAFGALGVSLTGALWAALPVGGIAIWAATWLLPRSGRLARPVAAYVTVLSLMMIAAAGSYAFRPSPPRAALLAAAILFAVSDLAVARDRLVSPGPANRLVGLPLYYAAQLLFAGAVSRAVA